MGRPALADEHAAWVVGSFYQALLTGVMAQWLIDPARAPSGRDLADALRIIVADVGPTNGSGATSAKDTGPADR